MRQSGEDSLLAEWRERVGRFEKLDLSVVEFCRQEGVSQGRFYYWRRKLKQERAAARSRSNRSSGRSAFVPVEVRGVVGEVVIEFPSGTRMKLPGGDYALVQSCIGALEWTAGREAN
jgi:transposase-like protein